MGVLSHSLRGAPLRLCPPGCSPSCAGSRWPHCCEAGTWQRHAIGSGTPPLSPCSLDRSDHLRLNRCPDVEVQGHPRGSPRRKRERADVGFLLGGQALATLIALAVPVLYNCVLTSLPPSLLESFEQGPFGNLFKD